MPGSASIAMGTGIEAGSASKIVDTMWGLKGPLSGLRANLCHDLGVAHDRRTGTSRGRGVQEFRVWTLHAHVAEGVCGRRLRLSLER